MSRGLARPVLNFGASEKSSGNALPRFVHFKRRHPCAASFPSLARYSLRLQRRVPTSSLRLMSTSGRQLRFPRMAIEAHGWRGFTPPTTRPMSGTFLPNVTALRSNLAAPPGNRQSIAQHSIHTSVRSMVRRLFSRVGDGWLVGFNHGEWGGALYWFSSDGKRNYKVSDHQIVQFFGLADGLYAIEGLAHMTMSEGSIIRISRGSDRLHWRADTFTKLPFAPYAVSVRQDNTMLVTLSDALVSIDGRGKVKTLLTNPPWIGLYPNSSVVSADGQKLYIGMRQFVEEIDLQTTKSRLLIPSEEFLNKLPAEDEQRIRSQYGS